eukprot:TRINITY_DN15999_c0_g2_i1.p1 TRINITY_DN15999_c0_g2~~TRINITY_DN15999_c0_g2_i1.p1  ORF type:complete len:109 (+),score=27.60 TRINITY_DN15999_c0_g2_i1:481-807(+)
MVLDVHKAKTLPNTLLDNDATSTSTAANNKNTTTFGDDNGIASNPLRGTWTPSCTTASPSSTNVISTVVDLRRKDHLYKALQAVLQTSTTSSDAVSYTHLTLPTKRIV